MLPKENRLTRRRDFDTLFKKGHSVGSRDIVLKFAQTKTAQPTRLAFIISAKTEKTAVKRNKSKRQMREIVRKVKEDIRPGYDGAFIAKTSFLPKTVKEKEVIILKMLERANLLK